MFDFSSRVLRKEAMLAKPIGGIILAILEISCRADPAG
jgi:hypothetical protein